MHHKRKRSPHRREMKRLDNKSYRMAEKHAIESDDRNPGTPRTERWAYRPEPLPLGDIPCNGKRHGKKKDRPKKERCSANGTHEWYKETTTEQDYFIRGKQGYPTCQECRALRGGRYWAFATFCGEHYEKVFFTLKVRKATCIHCWTEKILSSERIGADGEIVPRWGYVTRRRLVLKRRKLDLVAGMTVRS